MSKKLLAAMFVIGLSFCLTSSAHAATKDWGYVWTTSSATDSGKQKNFTLDQQPFAYLFINKDAVDPSTKNLNITWKWFSIGDEGKEKVAQEKYFSYNWKSGADADGNFQMWESPANWNDIQKSGDWRVRAEWSAKGGKGNGAAAANFNIIAPEPVSALLFLLGGAGLGIKRFFIKK
jgi:hypothetical protein